MIRQADQHWDYLDIRTQWQWSGEIIIRVPSGDKGISLYNEMVSWIKETVCTCYRNARWMKLDNNVFVRLRQEEDMLCFKLKYAPGNHDDSF